MAEEDVLRIPALSPCRRDYQLRSMFSHASEWDSSRPQSPWLPRSQSQQRAEEMMSPFRLYESSAGAGPIDRMSSRSGPLPSASRSYGYSYGSPLPNPSPLPSYFSGAAVPGIGSPTRSCRQSSSFAQRLPSASGENGGLEAVDVSYTSRSTTVSASPTNSRRRNCVSGELGRSCEVAQARMCKSGEIVGLEIRADGIFPIPESRKEDEKTDGVRKHRPSGSILWEALNDADNERPRRELSSTAIVPVPFKWEEAASASGKVSDSRMSETGDVKLVVSSPSSDVGTLAVPFKWEVTPGKPKLEEKANVDAPPALQLPPRLASASSMKRHSWSSSPPPFRAGSLSASLSSSVSKLSSSVGKQHSHRPIEEPPSLSTPRVLRPRALSGALTQFGTPQYQCADYSFCEDSSHRVRSPTSTLCGPGTPSSSSSSSSSRKPTHSLESFDRWTYGDHTTSTSRHSYTESQSEDSARGHEDVDQVAGAIVKLRKKLNLVSAKPPKSPKTTPSRNAYSFQGEEYFDCQAHVSSLALVPSDTEQGVEPATRLPYKMPSPLQDVEPSSPTRDVPDLANCLALPRFLTKGESSHCQWIENSTWNAPHDAPASSVLEDGYRSPAYKATLEMFSPSPGLLAKKSSKLRSSSSRRRHPHLVEVLCNTLKQSLQRCTKRSVAKTHSVAHHDDPFTRRHQSFMW